MKLAVVQSAGTVNRSASPLELDDFEQELVDQYALAAAAVGTTDAHIAQEWSVLFAFIRFLGRHVWAAQPQDVDRFLGHQRKELGLAKGTVYAKSVVLARFFEFMISRYQGEIQNPLGRDEIRATLGSSPRRFAPRA